MQPRQIDESVALVLDIVDAGSLLIRGVRHLVMVSAHRRDQAQLIGSGPVEDQRAVSAESRAQVVNDMPGRRLEPEIRAVARQASQPGEAFAVIAEADLVVGVVVAAVAEQHLSLAIALET